ncbi:MAG: hypothetical protein KKF56_00070 [Nanoarchaeota archaeon]|nr:hypothetical protein [Nanoarchaeota archaeon]
MNELEKLRQENKKLKEKLNENRKISKIKGWISIIGYTLALLILVYGMIVRF